MTFDDLNIKFWTWWYHLWLTKGAYYYINLNFHPKPRDPHIGQWDGEMFIFEPHWAGDVRLYPSVVKVRCRCTEKNYLWAKNLFDVLRPTADPKMIETKRQQLNTDKKGKVALWTENNSAK